jgi:predicted acyltransferase
MQSATVEPLDKTNFGVEAKRPERLMSLDLFRGITIAAMILVNDPGDGPSSYWPLKHSAWNGWTPTDLVFPFFLFIVGVATAFSFSSRLARGESRAHLLKHILWRGAILFAIGVFLNGFPNRYHVDSLRIYGVLQRIALCYVITALLELWTGWRTQLSIAISCLVGYWLLMRFVPVPGFGVPTHDIPLLDPDRNLVAWLDRKLMMGHLYEGTRDPEGVISDIPAIASCILGLLTGKWLKTVNLLQSVSRKMQALTMAAVGAAAIICAYVINPWFPINKKLWTSSYVLLTTGLALVCLALCYWLADAKRWRGPVTRFFVVFGRNAIAAYFLSEAVAALMERVHFGAAPRWSLEEYIYVHGFAPLASPPNASLLFAVVYVLLCWLAMAALYRKGIVIKI